MRQSLILVLVLASLVTAGLATSAAADDTTCTGRIGPAALDTTIIVPDGATCELDGTRADGNVMVGTGSTLVAVGVGIDGNIQAEGAASVQVADSRVDGSIQVVQGQDVRLLANRVGSDIQVFEQSGAVEIRDNVVDGNLQCKENAQAPVGGGNAVDGNAEDQCADLTGVAGGPAPSPTTPAAPGRTTTRLSGPDRITTAIAISADQFPSGAAAVYLARADQPADAVAGGVLTDGPILLVPSCGAMPPVVAAEIARLDPVEVVALGGPGAVCDAILEAAAAA